MAAEWPGTDVLPPDYYTIAGAKLHEQIVKGRASRADFTGIHLKKGEHLIDRPLRKGQIVV
ncbi:MAG: hypothetical protein E7324_02835 [Clostridiales bacterium]|nr:hypothetical protein [Clostridiales bacterium]